MSSNYLEISARSVVITKQGGGFHYHVIFQPTTASVKRISEARSKGDLRKIRITDGPRSNRVSFVSESYENVVYVSYDSRLDTLVMVTQ